MGGKDGHITPQDIYVGAEVIICGHKFLIVSADEFTLEYMEKNALDVCFNWFFYSVFNIYKIKSKTIMKS